MCHLLWAVLYVDVAFLTAVPLSHHKPTPDTEV